MRKILYLMMSVVVLLQLASCKTKSETGAMSVSSKDEKVRFENMLANTLSYDTYQSKANITFKSGSSKSMSVSSTFKLIKDKELQISVTPLLGIEVYRLVLTQDSIYLFDRMGSRYVAESYSKYKSYLPVDLGFETIQALFMNEMFIPGQNEVTKDDFKQFNWKTQVDNKMVGVYKKDKVFNLSFMASAENRLEKTISSSKGDKHKMMWVYPVFEDLNHASFPRVSNVEVLSGNKKYDVSISHSRISVNSDVAIDKRVPKSYKKIDLLELIITLLK